MTWKWYLLEFHHHNPGKSLMQQGLVSPGDLCKKGEHKEIWDGDLADIREPCKEKVIKLEQTVVDCSVEEIPFALPMWYGKHRLCQQGLR